MEDGFLATNVMLARFVMVRTIVGLGGDVNIIPRI
jgi:hypothetical protein